MAGLAAEEGDGEFGLGGVAADGTRGAIHAAGDVDGDQPAGDT